MGELQPFRYRAFISYSHVDRAWAKWLHGALEAYNVPRHLLGRNTPIGPVPRRLTPIFRDRDELPSAADLNSAVRQALGQSAALIVICSPSAARSRWVEEEVRLFRSLHGNDRIFALIVDGEPGTDHECFLPGLRATADGAVLEPLAADVRPGQDGKRLALLKLVAGLLGLGLDELRRRDQARQQRRMALITAGSVAGMLVTSSLAAVALLARNEAERQRQRAEVEATTARETTSFLVSLFEVNDPSEARGNTVTAREILDRGVARIERELTGQPAVRANLMQAMGQVYTGLGLYPAAVKLLQQSSALAPPADPQGDSDLRRKLALAQALYLMGDYAPSVRRFAEVETESRKRFPAGHATLSEALAGQAAIVVETDGARAERLFRSALAIDRRLHGDLNADVARDLAGTAEALTTQSRYKEAEPLYRRSLTIRRRILGDDHPLVTETLSNLGWSLYFAGNLGKAEPVFRDVLPYYRRVYGRDHPYTANALNNYGRILLEKGDIAEARAVLNEALAHDQLRKAPMHEDRAFVLASLGIAAVADRDFADAERLLSQALTIVEAHDHRLRGPVLTDLADVMCRSGRADQAEKLLPAARAALIRDYNHDDWRFAHLDSVEGGCRAAQGDRSAARLLLQRSQDELERRWGKDGIFAQLGRARADMLTN